MSSEQTITDNQLQTLALETAEVLKSHHLRLVTAESCTGGWLAKICTDISGSSDWFAHGIVSYSNESKMQFLQVPASTLTETGAVSEATVAAMALGATQGQDNQISVAISGVAGPGGGSDDKPVGTVCFGFAAGTQVLKCCTQLFSGDREAIRRRSVAFALQNIIYIARVC